MNDLQARVCEDGSIEVRLCPEHQDYARIAALLWAKSGGKQAVKKQSSVLIEHLLPAGPAPGVDEMAVVAKSRKVIRNGAPVSRLNQLALVGDCRKEWITEDDGGEFPEPKDEEEIEEEVIDKGAIGDTVESVGRWLAGKWESLETRHGRRVALTMAVAMIATLPLPGNITVIVGAAEAIRGLHGYFNKDDGGTKNKPKNRLSKSLTEKESFFAACDRDDKGRCTEEGSGGGESSPDESPIPARSDDGSRKKIKKHVK